MPSAAGSASPTVLTQVLSNMAASLHLGYCLHHPPILQMRGPNIGELRTTPKCRKAAQSHPNAIHILTGNLFPPHHTCQTRRAESRQALGRGWRVGGAPAGSGHSPLDQGQPSSSALIARLLCRLGKCSAPRADGSGAPPARPPVAVFYGPLVEEQNPY